jgi:transcriptional regulator with XRE-family HTH domain
MQQFSGERLQELRRSAGLNREHLSVAGNRCLTSISNYETGRVAPPVDVLVKLAAAIGCDVSDLFERVA